MVELLHLVWQCMKTFLLNITLIANVFLWVVLYNRQRKNPDLHIPPSSGKTILIRPSWKLILIGCSGIWFYGFILKTGISGKIDINPTLTLVLIVLLLLTIIFLRRPIYRLEPIGFTHSPSVFSRKKLFIRWGEINRIEYIIRYRRREEIIITVLANPNLPEPRQHRSFRHNFYDSYIIPCDMREFAEVLQRWQKYYGTL